LTEDPFSDPSNRLSRSPAEAPGNVLLPRTTTGLQKDSVANVSQIVALDRSLLTERVGRLRPKARAQVLHGIDVVLGR